MIDVIYEGSYPHYLEYTIEGVEYRLNRSQDQKDVVAAIKVDVARKLGVDVTEVNVMRHKCNGPRWVRG